MTRQEGPAFKASNFETTFCPPITSSAPGDEEEEEEVSENDQDQQEVDGEDGETENGESEWNEDSSRPFRLAATISKRHGIYLKVGRSVGRCIGCQNA